MNTEDIARAWVKKMGLEGNVNQDQIETLGSFGDFLLAEARRTVSGQEAKPSEFEAHGELDADGWTPFVFPDKPYFMKCCDCGLVHEMEFAAVKTEPTEGGFYSDELPWPDNRVRFKVRRADAAPIPATEPSAAKTDNPQKSPSCDPPGTHSTVSSTVASPGRPRIGT